MSDRNKRSTQVQTIQWGTDNAELFLLNLRYHEGRFIKLSGNAPILLDDSRSAWVIYKGELDIFSVQADENGELGPRRYLFTAEPGCVLCGITPLPGNPTRLLASGLAQTQVLKVRLASLASMARDPEFNEIIAIFLNNWLTQLTSSIRQELPPKSYSLINADNELTLKDGQVVRSGPNVLWITQLSGRSWLGSRASDTMLEPQQTVPLTGPDWLRASGDGTLRAVETVGAIQAESTWQDLESFNQNVLRILLEQQVHASHVQRTWFHERTRLNNFQVESAVDNLASILSQTTPKVHESSDQRDILFLACQLVGNALNIRIVQHPDALKGKNQADPLGDIARSSRVRLRQVSLNGAWWRSDSGPILGFLAEDRSPVALLPSSLHSYNIHNPSTGQVSRVDAAIARQLQPAGYTFYRSLPNRRVNTWDVFRLGLKGLGSDLMSLVWVGIASGLVAMLTPIVTGVIVDKIIPGSQRAELPTLVLVLIFGAIAVALFDVVRGITVLRIETKMESVIQAAVIDRLLNLPSTFFRDYSAGDLGSRAMGISTVRTILSRTVITTALALIPAVVSLLILFYYSVSLALLAVAMVLVLATIIGLTFYYQIRHQREVTAIDGKVSGLVLQLMTGIAKLHVAGGEGRAFAQWASLFADLRRATFKTRLGGALQITLNEMFNIAALMIIFSSMVFFQQSNLSTGGFLAFTVAFTQFLLAMLYASQSLAGAVAVVPLYDRVRPILETVPEIDATKSDPGELTGRIEVEHVTFRYNLDGTPTLKDISLDAEPGMFVALVGPSGSGKTTILRLLLGFNKPESGSILYDHKDLSALDIQALRRQVGVVLQNGKLMTGDILSNIIGSSPLTIDDAWEAAEMAGFAEDIRDMPMGMFTVISEGGGTLSGGQRQRLLISRAIVHKPRVLFFDEATSALDNRTQEIVSRSLEHLDATRIVIAHRLTTIQSADQIYVMQDGNIVQAGAYRQLLVQRGPFADLAKRQMA